MTTLREAAQMALQALQESKPIDIDDPAAFYRSAHAIEALRASLAQPEQEPVAWKDAPSKIYLQVCEDVDCDLSFDAHDEVSWCQDKINDSDIPYVRADFATPEREWVGLTDEDYEAMAEKYVTNCYFDTLKYARAIEAKLKEKNNE